MDFYQVSPMSWIQYIGGWWVGRSWGGMWGWVRAEGRLYHTLEHKSSYCEFIEVHKQTQFMSGQYIRSLTAVSLQV